MMKIGKDNSEINAFKKAMLEPHTLEIGVEVLDLNHKFIKDLSDRFVDGVVSVDGNAEVTRALDITLFDPFKQVHIDPDSASKMSVYITNMIAITYSVITADGLKRWDIPVFCGPIDKAERDDVWLDIKCLGKESLSIPALWAGKTFKDKQQKITVILQILRNLLGETKFDFTNKSGKLPNPLKLSRGSAGWKVAKKLASSLGLQLFYDGRGRCVLRRRPGRPVFKFTDLNITSKPQPVTDLTKVINAVAVIGKKKDKKPRIKFNAVIHKAHALSPFKLGRGNPIVRRYLWTTINDDSIGSSKEAKRVGRRVLRDGLLAGQEVKFTGVPVPALEELDPVRMDSVHLNKTFSANKFTIPLVAGDDATFGFLKRMKPRGGSRSIKSKNDKGRKAS